ncbi:MAG: ATP synthase F1 subunit gamma [Candidatus Omnitrophica bacterium]|nr:ATP synthase F1 subunit gamma [Candidatus Omnitrophota bacterium]
MPSLKHLRRRLRTVNSTKLITRAMRSVAASKMRRTQDRRDQIKPYANRLQKMVAHAAQSVGGEDQPLMQMRDDGKRLVVVVSSDSGLCGAFNNTVIRYAEDYVRSLSEEYEMYIIGKRAGSYFRKHGYPVKRALVDFKGNIVLDRILEAANEIKAAFLDEGFKAVDLIHNRAITAMAYKPQRERFLPLQEEELYSGLEEGASAPLLDYIFEPDAKTLLGELLPKFVETKIYYMFVDAFAAEHQARMLAMTTANENCIELIDALTLQMNKARQAAITTEITEIVGGAEALKG